MKKNKLTTIIILVIVWLLNSCAAAPGLIQLAASESSKEDAEKNFLMAEEYRLQSNDEMAFQYYRYSAFGGHQQAALRLGKYYYQGIGTPQDFFAARRIFEMIAWQDKLDKADEAYLYLAEIDFYGRGRPRTEIQGYKWMLIGTRRDSTKRLEMKKRMDPEMSQREISKAVEIAEKWLIWRDRDISGI